jgi:adenine phosphoribosyltransferase
MQEIKDAIGVVRDFPQKGIVFRDISGLLRVPKLRELALDLMAKHYTDNKIQVDIMAGIDSRGFIFGMGLAARLNIPFVMIRKPNKLPGEVVSVDYGLEYGKNSLSLQVGSMKAGDKVVVVDDLLATGGSAEAACHLVKKLGATVVGTCFAIELDGLDGRKKLPGMDVFSLVHFPAGDEPAPTNQPDREKHTQTEKSKEREQETQTEGKKESKKPKQRRGRRKNNKLKQKRPKKEQRSRAPPQHHCPLCLMRPIYVRIAEQLYYIIIP